MGLRVSLAGSKLFKPLSKVRMQAPYAHFHESDLIERHSCYRLTVQLGTLVPYFPPPFPGNLLPHDRTVHNGSRGSVLILDFQIIALQFVSRLMGLCKNYLNTNTCKSPPPPPPHPTRPEWFHQP